MNKKMSPTIDYKKINCNSDNLKIAVPSVVVSALRTIEEEKFLGNNVEFSIYSKIEKIENNLIIIENDFVVPKQIITFSNVEYCEHLEDYNVVIHKTPRLKPLSASDDEFINCNFDLALFYVDGKFEVAKFRVENNTLLVLIETRNIEVVYPKMTNHIKIEEGIKRIEWTELPF